MATFLTLIPKIANPMELRKYRPISIMGLIYKFISTILANRPKVVLPHIIDLFPGAFLNGKQILDVVLAANELIHSRKRSCKELCDTPSLGHQLGIDRVISGFLSLGSA